MAKEREIRNKYNREKVQFLTHKNGFIILCAFQKTPFLMNKVQLPINS